MRVPKFLLLLTALNLPSVLSSQSAFNYPPVDNEPSLPPNSYKFEWPIRRVAIIGAGVGGMIAYRELQTAGLKPHLFERDSQSGGTWHYTEQTPLNPPIPNAPISTADFEPSLPPRGVQLPYVEEYDNQTLCALQRREHRAPKAVWYNLITNTPAPIQQIRGFPWPDGTEWAVSRSKVNRYLQAFASWLGINTNDNNPSISYNTRVELIEKRLDSTGKHIGWTLTTKRLEEMGGGLNRATWNKEEFDAVVVVSGRWNAPNVPAIEGLEAWSKQFPDNILHSRQYRHPEDYAGKNVLIVGASASGSQISPEISRHAAKVYQSVRPDPYATQRPTIIDWVRQVPLNTTLIAEIKHFHPPNQTIHDSTIELVDGSILRDINYILFATGFRYSYPFLPEYHNPALGRTDEAPVDGLQPIVTDGSHLRSLHLDTFYINNPTLAFVNANKVISAFTYAEFQALAISMVWAGKAHLPARDEMWRWYQKRVEESGGYGKYFSSLGKREAQMRRFFQGWLNAAAAKYGGRQIDGLSFESSEIHTLWNRAFFGDSWLVRDVTIPGAENSGYEAGFAAAVNDDW
ncbi:hypothetical protein D9756_010066 [Leucocoprinus leucothites]|uniref:Dimethylaniline monooxygenase n=1 Tax=Leucocoprinus leucothites TaxID=201217 RepID=A0A8H5FRH6_9AGAR|nr:hypothetical protein D9756_010066 [Leucoagaricus leucothites]